MKGKLVLTMSPLGLWAGAGIVFRRLPLKLSEVDLSEIHIIEAEQKPIDAEPEFRSWWRKYII